MAVCQYHDTSLEENMMRTASPDQINDLLRAFSSLMWPAGRRAALDVAAARGWTVQLKTRNAVRFATNLGTNDDRARAFVMSDETTGELFDELTVHVADGDPDAPASVVGGIFVGNASLQAARTAHTARTASTRRHERRTRVDGETTTAGHAASARGVRPPARTACTPESP